MDFAVFATSLGWMAVAGSGSGILRVIMPRESRDGAFAALMSTVGVMPSLRERGMTAFDSLPLRLVRFMQGWAVEFPDQVDTATWTPFRSRVWSATRLIPYGQTLSYGQVAATIGQPRASRAVGQALHHNPVPVIVPCHRVIGADSSLTGFGSGIALKRALLDMESAGRATS